MIPPERISIVIPAYEEADRIGRTLNGLSHLDGIQEAEIIVVDGHPERTTIRALSGHAATGIAGPRGRGAQMHAGALSSRGSVLLFLHADTRLETDALVWVKAFLQDSTVAGGAFDLGIDAPEAAFRIIEAGASLRSRLTRIPYGDQALFMRKAVYFEMGGFRPIPLMEDVDLMRRLKKSGLKICLVPRRAWTSPRRWKKEGLLYCTLRNYALILSYYLGVSPERLSRYYR
ncbi:MAG: TIGR04283 family arsenosugar biosynthesis glycosyltransferase [Desulfobacterales bacterium]|jgi:rSAM/selenodomain-associated transferase 2